MGLSTYLDLLACPVCKNALGRTAAELGCTACGATYELLRGDCPVLLPRPRTMPPDGAADALRQHVHERFRLIDETLSERAGEFALFLNLGYAEAATPRQAARGPAANTVNRYSTQLVFEVAGQCDLDGCTTIEVGCGRGGNLAVIHEYYRLRCAIGIDLAPVNVAFCQRRYRLERGGFVVGDAECLPVRSGVADVVLNVESSHYYPCIERFLEEAVRVLVPGGYLLYADILPAAKFEAVRQHCDRVGFAVVRDQDISVNVMLACESTARKREDARYARLYEMFDVVPGSPKFEGLRTGELGYRIVGLRKRPRAG